MNRILDSDGRIGGSVERPSFKSHLCEIKSLKEKETSLLPHLHVEEAQGRSKASTKGTPGAPIEAHSRRDSTAWKVGGGGQGGNFTLLFWPNAGDSKGWGNQFPFSHVPGWRRSNSHSREVGAGLPWATSFLALLCLSWWNHSHSPDHTGSRITSHKRSLREPFCPASLSLPLH